MLTRESLYVLCEFKPGLKKMDIPAEDLSRILDAETVERARGRFQRRIHRGVVDVRSQARVGPFPCLVVVIVVGVCAVEEIAHVSNIDLLEGVCETAVPVTVETGSEGEIDSLPPSVEEVGVDRRTFEDREARCHGKVEDVRLGETEAVVFGTLTVLGGEAELFSGSHEVHRGVGKHHEGAVVSAVPAAKLDHVAAQLFDFHVQIDLGGVFLVGFDIGHLFQIDQTELLHSPKTLLKEPGAEDLPLLEEEFPAQDEILGVVVPLKGEVTEVSLFVLLNL